MPPPNWDHLGVRLYWAYANLAMAHAAVEAGALNYGRKHYMIRSRLFAGLRAGTMHVSGFLDDDRLKLNLPRDHLVPRARGGQDESDNIVWACSPCNSSKGKSDLLVWTSRKGTFPALLLYRRYLKLAIIWCTERNLLEVETALVSADTVPFAVELLPMKLPAPSQLRLWVKELDLS
jgi:hypothetical protein